jgi:hypothetical protein
MQTAVEGLRCMPDEDQPRKHVSRTDFGGKNMGEERAGRTSSGPCTAPNALLTPREANGGRRFIYPSHCSGSTSKLACERAALPHSACAPTHMYAGCRSGFILSAIHCSRGVQPGGIYVYVWYSAGRLPGSGVRVAPRPQALRPQALLVLAAALVLYI